MTWVSRNRLLIAATAALMAAGAFLYDMTAPAQVGYVLACAPAQVGAMLLDHHRVMRQITTSR